MKALPLLSLAAAVLLAGCVTHETGSSSGITTVSPGYRPGVKTDEAGIWLSADKAEVATSPTWSGQGGSDGFVWTQDGPGMDSLFFHLVVKDGKPLFEAQDVEKNHSFILKLMNRQPDQISFRFSKSMTEWEIVEFFTTSWGKLMDDVPVKVEAMAPASLDGHPGIRFQYSYTPKDELRRRGFGIAAVVDDKLYLVHYLGSAIYHFDKNKAEAEQVIASLKIKKG